jgi:Ni/Fe-hydrogenase 1 B-type cytochrome subunit
MSSSNVHDLARFEAEQISQARSFKSVYVYQAPIRIWHWVNALAFCVLAVTGWLIASPLPSPGGEASSHHMMGTLRYLHFSAGYIMAFGLLGRIYWAFVGNQFARELFWLPLFQLPYWKDLWSMLKWYAFASQSPHQYMGHNPLARLIMFSLFLCPTVLMVLTGFAMYAEGQGADTWFDGLFGWVTPLFGSSQDVHTWHHLGLWGLICFVIIHTYAATREEILGRSSMLSTMVSGWRTFKD